MDILSYILSKKNSGSNPGGSGGSTASVEVAGGGTVVAPTQTYSRLYFNTKLTNEEIMALMDTLELTYGGVGNLLYATIYRNSGEMDGILAAVVADTDMYALMRMLTGEILFAINGNVMDETITFTGWNPNIDFSNGIEISGETVGTELPIDGGSIPIGANNDKITDLFSSEPIKESINKGLSGTYDGTNLEVESTHIDISALLDEHKLPLNINVVDDSLMPSNIVSGVNILGVEGSYSASGFEDELVNRTLTTYTNNRVTNIGTNAFQNYADLTAVKFSNVTDIGAYAFSACGQLASIDFPKAINIGSYAFNNCASLTEINFPNAVNTGIRAFDKCTKLTSAVFPSATNIDNYTFANCILLATVDCPKATSIGTFAFYNNDSLTSLNAPLVTTIGNYAFDSCKLANLDFSNVISIGEYAFNSCSGLTNIYFPEATDIGVYAFNRCHNLISVDFPKANNIGEYAFSECSRLSNIKLPNVTNISRYAFNKCGGLENINLPKITSLGYCIFYNCRNLVSIDAPLLIDIGQDAFEYCTSLTTINAPLVNNIDAGAFSGCSSLTNSDFPNATNIDNYAYYNCTRLTKINAPLLTTIGLSAFENCYSLINLFISQTDQICVLENIDAFTGCYHILGTTNATYNPNGLKDGYIYVQASLLSQYKVATNWSTYSSQIIGHEDLEAGATLPNYTTDNFTTQTWYSDEKLTTVVTEVTTTGKYYCRLEA